MTRESSTGICAATSVLGSVNTELLMNVTFTDTTMLVNEKIILAFGSQLSAAQPKACLTCGSHLCSTQDRCFTTPSRDGRHPDSMGLPPNPVRCLMSGHSPKSASHSLPSSSHLQSNSEPAERIQRFQEAAQALLGFPLANEPGKPEEPTAGQPASGDDGEVRCYYLCPATARLEKELLRKYRVNDFQELMDEAHTMLAGLVKLMQSVDKDVRVRGYVISSLGTHLGHVSALVHRMRNVYGKMRPVRR